MAAQGAGKPEAATKHESFEWRGDPMVMQQCSIPNRNLSTMGRLESVGALVATASQLIGEKM